MHYTYSISVSPKTRNDKRVFWFQKGVLTLKPDKSKNFSSHKGFRTSNKLERFCIWLDSVYPDVVVNVLEIRQDGRRVYDIPMGDDWRNCYDNNQA